MTQAVARITANRAHAEGPLKITTTVAFGSAWLTSRINEFHQKYPDISVSVALADSPELHLFSRQADVAIRFMKQTHPKLVQLRLMTIQYRFFANREYVNRRGIPASAQDLDGHRLIVFGSDMPVPFETINWILGAGREGEAPRSPALCVNSVYGMYRAVKSRLRIAALPHYISDESPELVEILREIEAQSIDTSFVYPEELRSSKRVAVIRDFLLEQTAADRSQAVPLAHESVKAA